MPEIAIFVYREAFEAAANAYAPAGRYRFTLRTIGTSVP
jgi:hypothetical protein